MLDSLELQLCDIQGRLFERSGKKGLDSLLFAQTFMTSEVAGWLDERYNRMQWAGEEYLLEELQDSHPVPTGKVCDTEMLYWTGYLYRYWHYSRNESSRNIVQIAPPKVMFINYLMFHTFDPELAIDDLIEIHCQKEEKQKMSA